MPSAHVYVPVWRMAWAVWFRITWAECFRPRKGRLKKYWRVYKDGEFGRYYLHGLPIIGDALPLAAGWLRLNALHCAIILITGKLLRYAMIYWGMNAVAG